MPRLVRGLAGEFKSTAERVLWEAGVQHASLSWGMILLLYGITARLPLCSTGGTRRGSRWPSKAKSQPERLRLAFAFPEAEHPRLAVAAMKCCPRSPRLQAVAFG